MFIGYAKSKSDVEKFYKTQEELLNIKISNDSYLSKANYNYQNNIEEPLPEYLNRTKEELIADDIYQQDEARKKLQKIGFTLPETIKITSTIGPDGVRLINQSFPSIRVMFTNVFDVKSTTPQTFIDWFKQNHQEWLESKGLSFGNDGGFNNALRNVSDLKAIIPDKESLKELLKKVGSRSDVDTRKINELINALPSSEFWEGLANNSVENNIKVTHVLNSITSIPTKTQIDKILQMKGEKLYDAINLLLAKLQTKDIKILKDSTEMVQFYKDFYEAAKNMTLEVFYELSLDEKTDIVDSIRKKNGWVEDIMGRVEEEVKLQNLSKEETENQIFDRLFTYWKNGPKGSQPQPRQTQQAPTKFNINNYPDLVALKQWIDLESDLLDEMIKYRDNDQAIVTETGDIISEGELEKRIDMWNELNDNYKHSLAEYKKIFEEEQRKKKQKGDGLKKTVFYGKGIAQPSNQPAYVEFGKFIIQQKQLETGRLNVRYKSKGPFSKIKAQNISDTFKDFLLNLIETNKFNERFYEQVPPDEKRIFEVLVQYSGLDKEIKVPKFKSEVEDKDYARFELLRGEYLAGNNNANMIKELRKLIIKFVSVGRISQDEGYELLSILI